MFASLLLLVPTLFAVAAGLVFSPALFLAGIGEAPAVALLSPLASQLAQAGLFGLAFEAVFLLIAGRHVERALGGVGVVLTFIAGAYGGALARLILTAGSATSGFAANGGLFAVIGAYLMLYGVPRSLPVAPGRSRPAQIAVLAAVWAVLQLVFMLVSRGVDLSVALIEPLGGLAAGVAVARPLLAWRYRRA